jgi:hypothetical protein
LYATGDATHIKCSFEADGSIVITDRDFNVLWTTTWITQSVDISAIANQYEVVSVTKFSGTSQTSNSVPLPYNLQFGFDATVTNSARLSSLYFDFLVSIIPVSGNPRYGESGYYGQYRFKGTVEQLV